MPQRHLTEWSVQQRIALRTAFAVCLAMLLGTFLILEADSAADEALFDQQIQYFSHAIADTLVTEGPQWDSADAPSALLASVSGQTTGLIYQVWRQDGTLLRHSAHAPSTAPLAPIAVRGYSTFKIQDHSYRGYSLLSADGTTVVQVAELINDQEALRIGMLMVYLVSLILPLYITWRASRNLLERSKTFISTMAAGVARQDPQDARPMLLGVPPSDFVPLMQSVNDLVQRASTVISLEQQFTSVAAHELKSPLAGIRAQAQLAGRATTEQELQECLQGVMVGVDHAARVFDQLLDLTRMEGLSQERETNFEPVDLKALFLQIQAEQQALLTRKRICFLANCLAPQLLGVEFAIYLLLRNLVANAILYTPEGGRVEVCSFVLDGHLVLCIDDSGPGIAEADRERVFERFQRLHRTADEGMGLGLFIAQQAARLHHADIELLRSHLGGLRARVGFPVLGHFDAD